MKLKHELWLGTIVFTCFVFFFISKYYDRKIQADAEAEAQIKKHDELKQKYEHKKEEIKKQNEQHAHEQLRRQQEQLMRQEQLKEQETKQQNVPTYVYFDVAKQDFLKDPHVGRVIIELYPKYAPKTVKNFMVLCQNKKYVNIPFHRIIQGFMIQGGDIVKQDGTGSFSIFGGENSTFEDEEFILKHDSSGVLSMANSGPNTNGSQFFITLQPTPHLNGKHVVFGKVVRGMEHIHDFERELTDSDDRPLRKCYISNSGLWTTKLPKKRIEANLIENNSII